MRGTDNILLTGKYVSSVTLTTLVKAQVDLSSAATAVIMDEVRVT